jgi:uncharacterized protein YdeI (YjbR/CyaY-like superfamily)
MVQMDGQEIIITNMEAVFFKNQLDFRKWLKKNHQHEKELLVGFYKKGSGKMNMTWSESVDQALCFGWIDGVTRSIDEVSYCIRFTPRKANSIWSNVNIKKVEALIQSGMMEAAGMSAYGLRKAEKSGIYSFEKEAVSLAPELEKEFKRHVKAYQHFHQKSPSYRKQMIHLIMDAKREETRWKRLEKLIMDCTV